MAKISIHQGHVLGAAAFLALPLALFMSKSMAPLSLVAAVAALAVHVTGQRRFPPLAQPFGLLLGGVVAWGWLSWFWSIAPDRTLGLVAPLAGQFFAGLVLVAVAVRLRDDERRFLETALVAGVLFGMALLALEVLSPLVLTNFLHETFKGHRVERHEFNTLFFQPGATVATLMAWPAAAALWRRGHRAFAGLLFAALIALLAKSGSGAGLLGALAGFAVFVAMVRAPGGTVRTLMVVLALGIAATPIIPRLVPEVNRLSEMAPNLPDAVFPRVLIWQTAAGLAREVPLGGKGLNSSRAISSQQDRVVFHGWHGEERKMEPIPLHPHNAALQVWLELGAVGALFMAALLIASLRAIEATAATLPSRALAHGALVSALFIALVSYGIWQAWWQGTLWMTAAFVAAMVGRGER